MATITIEQVNYFGQATGSDDYNAKALYRKYGKLRIVHVYVDFWNNSIYIAKNQPKECKVLSGLSGALRTWFENNPKL